MMGVEMFKSDEYTSVIMLPVVAMVVGVGVRGAEDTSNIDVLLLVVVLNSLDGVTVIKSVSLGETVWFTRGVVTIELSVGITTELTVDITIVLSIDVTMELLADITMELTADVKIELSVTVTMELLADITMELSVDIKKELSGDIIIELAADIIIELAADVTNELTADGIINVAVVCNELSNDTILLDITTVVPTDWDKD
jgi:hypothetical protein